MQKIYEVLGNQFEAFLRAGSEEFKQNHEETINKAVDLLPHGYGIDGDTVFDFEKSKPDKLIINSWFHYMNDGGYCDGWTEFKIVVTPSWTSPNVDIIGRFKSAGQYYGVKEYLEEVFYDGMTSEIAFC